MVVVFSKVAMRHLGVLFRVDLRRLGGHSGVSPVPPGGGGGLKSIFTHGYLE